MSWFSKKPGIAPAEPSRRMEGLWVKCEVCHEILYRAELEKQLNVCPHCQHHMLWPARERLSALLDAGVFQEMDRGLMPEDVLSFTDSKRYKDRLKATQKAEEEEEAFLSGLGRLGGRQVSIGCFLFRFMGGSMGSVVGEKITRVFERAYELECPAIIFSASGGARMQEGILSLMQMAKTSAALARFREVKQPYISVMLHPTTGGVAASFAWLGDIVLAEPKALIGFAGPRVIEQTIHQKLPEGFQRSEFLLEHGMLDGIVQRKDMRARLIQLLELLA